jgi:hypothetical protein
MLATGPWSTSPIHCGSESVGSPDRPACLRAITTRPQRLEAYHRRARYGSRPGPLGPWHVELLECRRGMVQGRQNHWPVAEATRSLNRCTSDRQSVERSRTRLGGTRPYWTPARGPASDLTSSSRWRPLHLCRWAPWSSPPQRGAPLEVSFARSCAVPGGSDTWDSQWLSACKFPGHEDARLGQFWRSQSVAQRSSRMPPGATFPQNSRATRS